MNSQEKVLDCYNTVADDYAIERWDELSKKHIDRLLLTEFANLNKSNGPCPDFGCGPGQTTRFLFDHGLKNITGIDLAPAMAKPPKNFLPRLNLKLEIC